MPGALGLVCYCFIGLKCWNLAAMFVKATRGLPIGCIDFGFGMFKCFIGR